MRRWNGWGDTSVVYPLPEKSPKLLQELVGTGVIPQDAKLESVLDSVPDSRLASHPMVDSDPMVRLCHARGQSLPDWVALRSGKIGVFPDAVAHPMNSDEIVELLRYANRTGAHLIPYGGGTSVVGHINPLAGDRPVLTVNMRRLNQLEHFDKKSQLATFGGGVSGPELEAQLRARGFTLGHFPQSFELSTLGGWIATRSSGQQSLGYGRIEDLFAGGTVICPSGILEILPHPASAAGPDLRELVLGSEGRMGIISRAIVRTSPLPEKEEFRAIFFPSFEQGKRAVRQMVQSRLPLSMLRLSTAIETSTMLALAGHERVISLLEKGLSFRHIGDEKSMLLIGFSGSENIVKSSRKTALSFAHQYNGVSVGQQFGKQWNKGRFRTPYLRNTLWEQGYALDTLETAVKWENVDSTIKAIESALRTSLDDDIRVHVFTHLSHFYPTGASIYTTYMYALTGDPDETLRRWFILKSAASEAIVQHKGTISHQHGVGLDHARYLEFEKGALGMEILADITHRFDPKGILNPGKLLAEKPPFLNYASSAKY